MADRFKTSIGKDVIESLTFAMYEDSRFIFREYIQNAADQIDRAIKDGLLLAGDAQVHVILDRETKKVIIEDNATGIPTANCRAILQNIAQSSKRRGIDKGFRGIGRLGGLAYCGTLTFETSAPGESVKSTLKWDAKKLKHIINNRSDKQEAASVIEEITLFQVEAEEPQKHYFKVILEDVTNDELLDKDAVDEYLSMVAPVGYPTKFIFRSKVHQYLSEINQAVDEYRIFLNAEQLFKGYSTYIKKDETQAPVDQVVDLTFFHEKSSDGQLLYWGWHSLSERNQSMSEINRARGFRLRKSNIQIGDEFTLLKLHRDKRFQFYFFGEIFAVHQDLIPNSRRDYFVENSILREFEHKVQTYFHTHVYKLCYSAADINTFLRKAEELKAFETEFQKKEEIGFTDKQEREEFRQKFEQKRDDAIKARKKIEKIERDSSAQDLPVRSMIARVVNNDLRLIPDTITIPEKDAKPKYRTDRLSSLNKDQRRFLGRVLSIIKHVLDKETAENLIQKIEEEFK